MLGKEPRSAFTLDPATPQPFSHRQQQGSPLSGILFLPGPLWPPFPSLTWSPRVSLPVGWGLRMGLPPPNMDDAAFSGLAHSQEAEPPEHQGRCRAVGQAPGHLGWVGTGPLEGLRSHGRAPPLTDEKNEAPMARKGPSWNLAQPPWLQKPPGPGGKAWWQGLVLSSLACIVGGRG